MCQMHSREVGGLRQRYTGNEGVCGKPARYIDPRPRMGVEYVCGIHARSIDAMYRRIGSNLRCIPIKESSHE